MSEKIVLVDVDGVVADLHTEWCRRISNTHHLAFTPEMVTSWDMERLVPEHVGERVFDHLWEDDLYDHVQPIPGARQGTERLRELGYRVVYLTSSNDVTAGQKMRWLKRHDFLVQPEPHEYADVITAHDKSLVPGFALIDDGAHNLSHAPVRRRLLFDQPHNRSVSGYERVSSWAEVTETLMPREVIVGTVPPWTGYKGISE